LALYRNDAESASLFGCREAIGTGTTSDSEHAFRCGAIVGIATIRIGICIYISHEHECHRPFSPLFQHLVETPSPKTQTRQRQWGKERKVEITRGFLGFR